MRFPQDDGVGSSGSVGAIGSGRLREATPPLRRRSTKRDLSLTDQETRQVRALLKKPMGYKHDPMFDEPDIEETLFDASIEVPRPVTDWFLTVMERGEDGGDGRGSVGSLLNAEQERCLFMRYNYARMKVVELQQALREQRTWKAVRARELLHWGGVAAELRDTLARFNLGLVVAMAKRSRARNLDFSEQISEGCMALLNAVDKFNPSLGFKFSTYACKLILNALNHAGIRQSRHRAIFATGFEISTDQADSEPMPAEQVSADCVGQIRVIVDKNVARLSELEQEVVRHRFPLSDADAPDAQTLAQVGHRVGLTKEGVRRVQLKALRKIRQVIQREYPDLKDEFEMI